MKTPRLTLGLPASLALIAFLAAPPRSTAAPPPGDSNPSAFRIVSPDWVAEHTGDPTLKILDVRTSVAAYQYGHVPNAVFLANDTLRAPLGGIPVQYLDPDAMAAIFRRAGIDVGDQVVVYGEGKEVLGATMVAYGLQRIGHDNVAILDGGLEAYRASHPLTQAYPSVTSGSVSPDPDESIFITFEELRGRLHAPGVTILDTRPAVDYLGNTSRWMRNGHIPGAINLDWHQLMAPDNFHAFKPVEEMRRLVESTGVTPGDDVIVYCGTSREATLVYQVMRHVLSYPNVRLYEGSWTEYASKAEMPVERIPAAARAAAVHRPPTTGTLQPYECGDVTRLHTLDNIFLASQPGVEDFKQAQLGGIRTVINQRHASENKEFDERAVVTSLGMNYHNPAWSGPDELTDRLIDQTRDLLRTAERPILLHCSSANRAGAIWLAYSLLDRGLAWDDALAEAKTVGLRSPDYERIVRAYVARRQRDGAARSSSTLDGKTQDALRAALADERRAQGFYQAVMDRFGERRPFSRIIRAERRHEALLVPLFEKHAVPVPADERRGGGIEVPGTFAESCEYAVEFERQNIAMYDGFLAFVAQEDIREVMTMLREASAERHLPAFQRSVRR